MPATFRRREPMTIEVFDAFVEEQADDRAFELIEGEIVMMTNPTETHEQIAGNIGAPLNLTMDARGTDKTKADVVVRCGPAGNSTYVIDPLVIVEVLSPSTMDIDRGAKLGFYKSLPTLRHIAPCLSGADAS